MNGLILLTIMIIKIYKQSLHDLDYSCSDYFIELERGHERKQFKQEDSEG